VDPLGAATLRTFWTEVKTLPLFLPRGREVD